MSPADEAVPIVVDTSILIDHLRGRPQAREVLVAARSSGRRVWSSVVVRMELLGGMRSDERRRTHALIDAIEWVDVDSRIADRAGELARTHRRTNPDIDIAGYLIAATAEIARADLKTLNVTHFPMIPGLKPPY